MLRLKFRSQGAQVSPDAEVVAEAGADHPGGEALKGDGAAVAAVGQGLEEAPEVHASGAQVSPVALTDVNVPGTSQHRMLQEEVMPGHIEREGLGHTSGSGPRSRVR